MHVVRCCSYGYSFVFMTGGACAVKAGCAPHGTTDARGLAIYYIVQWMHMHMLGVCVG